MCQWFLLLVTLKLTYSQQIFAARMVLSNPGTQFVPVNTPALLISTTLTSSVKRCAISCTNNILCRIYDYGVSVPNQCRLFEGDANTLGQIVPSSSPQSRVGTIYLSPALFTEYNSPCSSSCYHSRYLQCGDNFTCECMPHTYWDASVSMCVPQSPILGAPCQQNKSMCREDINYTCLQFNQCGPLSVLSGTTLMDNSTVVVGSATIGLNIPYGIDVFGTNTDSVIVVDLYNNRLIGLWNVGTIHANISVVATEGIIGQPLCRPYDVHVDSRSGYNLYLSDYCSAHVILYTNMQSISPPARIVAGTNVSGGSRYEYLNVPFGIQVDNHSNVYVVSMMDHYIMFWPPYSRNGTVVAGLGIPSNTSMGLDTPCGLALDERNSWLYVADANNHRIQRYSLNGSWPCDGTTVAGGNGRGNGSHQLYEPMYIKISTKTGAMYIIDSGNNRIQRWEQGANAGVTIAGDPNGNPGSSATLFNSPSGLAINANETQMYVTDTNNNRLQRFQLI